MGAPRVTVRIVLPRSAQPRVCACACACACAPVCVCVWAIATPCGSERNLRWKVTHSYPGEYRLLSSFTHRTLYILGNRRCPQDVEGCVDPLAGLDILANRRPLSVTGNGTPVFQSPYWQSYRGALRWRIQISSKYANTVTREEEILSFWLFELET
jgi:hypothetical protein